MKIFISYRVYSVAILLLLLQCNGLRFQTHHRFHQESKDASCCLRCTENGIIRENQLDFKSLKGKLDKEFVGVALPAFVSLAADPLASIVDAIYVGRLGANEQAGMGIAISAQYSVAKLYNDPLLKVL